MHHCIGDCAAAMRYLRQNAARLGLLPEKICVCGESAGGHLALCLGTPAIVADPLARPNYIINFNGAVDLTGRLNRELFGPCDMQTVQAGEWLEKYRAGAAVSPLLQAGPDNTPVTHMQGLTTKSFSPMKPFSSMTGFPPAAWKAASSCCPGRSIPLSCSIINRPMRRCRNIWIWRGIFWRKRAFCNKSNIMRGNHSLEAKEWFSRRRLSKK